MEVYKEIKGYYGYFVSNFGNVKSIKENYKDKLLKGRLTNCGYLRVALWKNKKQKDFSSYRTRTWRRNSFCKIFTKIEGNGFLCYFTLL